MVRPGTEHTLLAFNAGMHDHVASYRVEDNTVGFEMTEPISPAFGLDDGVTVEFSRWAGQ